MRLRRELYLCHGHALDEQPGGGSGTRCAPELRQGVCLRRSSRPVWKSKPVQIAHRIGDDIIRRNYNSSIQQPYASTTYLTAVISGGVCLQVSVRVSLPAGELRTAEIPQAAHWIPRDGCAG